MSIGRYAFETELNRFASRFELGSWGVYVQPRYNIAPGQMMPVITRHSPNKAQWMQWGLVSNWSKHPILSPAAANVRAEVLMQKANLRRLLASRRCLVPASGFYIWGRAKGSQKQPYYVRLNQRSLMAFAGLYDVWRDNDGNELKSYTIITTAANDLIAPYQDRMPAILREDHEDLWLDSATHDTDLLASLLNPGSEPMTVYAVSPELNEANSDGPDLIVPFAR